MKIEIFMEEKYYFYLFYMDDCMIVILGVNYIGGCYCGSGFKCFR